MRRCGCTIAVAVLLAFGGVLGVQQSAGASTPRRDDNAAVCAATAKTVTVGLNAFVADMHQVRTQAGQGDLAGAEGSVKHAGANLVAIAGGLRKDAEKADDTVLKTTVGGLANEFERLGLSLNQLTGLQTFDTRRLDGLARKMTTLCARAGSPGASSTG